MGEPTRQGEGTGDPPKHRGIDKVVEAAWTADDQRWLGRGPTTLGVGGDEKHTSIWSHDTWNDGSLKRGVGVDGGSKSSKPGGAPSVEGGQIAMVNR
jgi:hypothetical protein